MTVDIVGPGDPGALGVRLTGSRATFSVHSSVAESVDLCVFHPRQGERRLPLRRTGDRWHAEIDGVRAGTRYGIRVAGRYQPRNGLFCDQARLLVDPYARGLAVDPLISVMVPEPEPLAVPGHARIGWPDTVIYELHVAGFTKLHPDIPPHLRGTYAGLAHPAAIRHLTELGVSTVELLPVQARATEASVAARHLTNYWGYNTIGFFAPDPRFASSDDVVGEVREMVRTLHDAGLEVVLDVVYNHTAEGQPGDPILSWRGLDNPAYYRLDPWNRRQYWDVTGCGNTLDVRQPVVREMILDSLRYWVTVMGVDGFRFDLATALGRLDGDDYTPDAPLLAAIQADPVLSRTKLIAEPWDLGPGGYRLTGFPPGWAEWNDRFRNCFRDFWLGGSGISELGTRLCGSTDLFSARTPSTSVNFVTAHDGFTMADLVAYSHKHNEANGENNADGTDDNRSNNFGVEGPTDDPAVLAIRKRSIRNLLSTLILSVGTPMICQGDEFGRTQRGNNNAYCQDSEISWVDWTNADLDLLAFTRRLLAVRRSIAAFRPAAFYTGEGDPPDACWFRPDGALMPPEDWNDPACRTLGMYVRDDHDPATAGYLFWLHGGESDLTVKLPADPYAAGHELVLSTAGTPDVTDSVLLVARSATLLRCLAH
ncbi:glycogen debranching protein GlgX [Fodinicola acaciae]|uniref:glycogen debranching protein GlgX n=1 Tax=Fodinicola acaciae TaxID=2681555 RepID=UPI0013D3B1FE|nr:glycogen debranching protein GlgX [Fodinicola acaciae]